MSNVLIGIIGVILFIGLALAGALFLGPRFQEASNSSKAAATVSHLRQIATGVNAYEIQNGETMIAANHSADINFLLNGYMKSFPTNPFSGETYRLNDRNANIDVLPVAMIMTPIGTDDRAREGCVMIEKQVGIAQPDMAPKTDFGATFASKGPLGCFLYAPTANYYAYVKV